MTPWSISVKTVGGGPDADNNANFTVSVSPDDEISSLNDQIEGVTGLKASQQRLIYRGRLLGGGGAVESEQSENTSRIRDVAGLGDGQTIHLVPKRELETAAAAAAAAAAATASDETNSPSAIDGSNEISGSGTASLLAALLGLGRAGAEDDTSLESIQQRQRERREQDERRREQARSVRIEQRRRRYRLTAADLTPTDPGSMEHVRQGLMTMHTVLDAQSTVVASPLDANRQWYHGQWIDCLDTVNQWLEATVVDILLPEDVLPGQTRRSRQGGDSATASLTEESIVTANDNEGRRKLLLEPCDEGDEHEIGGDLAGFRERDNNENVQLLLIHYNGWPHRWDEWIRSDSKRIRPFRTRSRHPTSSSHISPSPQATYRAAPSTNINGDDDRADRRALLSELSRVLSSVNDRLGEVASAAGPLEPSENANRLPWRNNNTRANSASESTNPHEAEVSVSASDLNRAQLEALAPLLDRLGRTLIDAAPHVAALAADLPEERSASNAVAQVLTNESENSTSQGPSNESHVGGLFSLLSRGESRRRITEVADDAPSDTPNTTVEAPSIDPDHVDFVNAAVNTNRSNNLGGSSRRGSDDGGAGGLLGAYLAAASLGGSSGGDGGGENRDDDGSGALGRILRQGGTSGGGGGGGSGSGGGIDIHIHAIVTGPGVGPGAGGLAMLGGGPTATTGIAPFTFGSSSPSRTGTTTSATPQPAADAAAAGTAADVDDMGLFSDLYSENPQPTNHSDDHLPRGFHDLDEPANNDEDMDLFENTLDELPDSDNDESVQEDEEGDASPNDGERRSPNRSNSRRGNSFGRIIRRAMGRRSSRDDRTGR